MRTLRLLNDPEASAWLGLALGTVIVGLTHLVTAILDVRKALP